MAAHKRCRSAWAFIQIQRFRSKLPLGTHWGWRGAERRRSHFLQLLRRQPTQFFFSGGHRWASSAATAELQAEATMHRLHADEHLTFHVPPPQSHPLVSRGEEKEASVFVDYTFCFVLFHIHDGKSHANKMVLDAAEAPPPAVQMKVAFVTIAPVWKWRFFLCFFYSSGKWAVSGEITEAVALGASYLQLSCPRPSRRTRRRVKLQIDRTNTTWANTHTQRRREHAFLDADSHETRIRERARLQNITFGILEDIIVLLCCRNRHKSWHLLSCRSINTTRISLTTVFPLSSVFLTPHGDVTSHNVSHPPPVASCRGGSRPSTTQRCSFSSWLGDARETQERRHASKPN